jgi:hypothetical protein
MLYKPLTKNCCFQFLIAIEVFCRADWTIISYSKVSFLFTDRYTLISTNWYFYWLVHMFFLWLPESISFFLKKKDLCWRFIIDTVFLTSGYYPWPCSRLFR